ncbi:MAG: ferritin-like domain-containing protein [Candidatus Sericytochromatia bacterium]|nr:ferritin-like domain-containing protein [Candidatus Tanganyikabacteria bacterium]
MAASDLASVIDTLNRNIALEHSAIVQYLLHAYAMGEGGVGAEVINIARAEMRHLKYFADVVVDLGGDPAVHARAEMFLEADSAAAMMRNGVAAEEGAIREYSAALASLDHPVAQRVIERVILDEQFHRHQFVGFVAEVGDAATAFPVPPPADEAARKATALLDEAVNGEYRGILLAVREYLRSRDFKRRDRFEEVMLWAMKHVGLLADEVSERRAQVALLDLPDIPPVSGAAALDEAIAQEEARAALYSRLATELLEPDLRQLLSNLAGHEAYDLAELRFEAHDLAARALAGAARCPFHAPPPAATVGSLMGRPQP